MLPNPDQVLRRGLAAFVCLVASDCGNSIDLPADQLWRSAHFRYHSRANNTKVCPDLLPVLEAHAAVIHQAVGLPWEPSEVIDYYDFNDAADFSAHAGCEQFSDGCTVGTSVRSFVPFLDHELVHAYFSKLGRQPPFLEEGTAVALSCQLYDFTPHTAPAVSWRDAFSAGYNDASHTLFIGGGWLVSRLLATRDVHLFLEFYGTAGGFGASADEFAAAFTRVYGASIDEVWTEAVTAPGGTLFCPWQCSRPVLPTDGSQVSLASVCGLSTDQHTFSLAASNDMLWSGTGDIQFDIRDCDYVKSLEGEPVAFGTTPSFGAIISLDAGRYYFERQIRNTPATVSATASLGALVGDSCASLVTVPVDPAAAYFYIHLRPSATARSITLTAPLSRAIVAGLSNGTDGFVTWCPGCGANPSWCVPLSTRAPPAFPDIGITLGTSAVFTAQPGEGVLISLWPLPSAR